MSAELFRWTFAGRPKFLDDRLNCSELVKVPRLSGTAIIVLFPAIHIVRAVSVQSFAQSVLADAEDFG